MIIKDSVAIDNSTDVFLNGENILNFAINGNVIYENKNVYKWQEAASCLPSFADVKAFATDNYIVFTDCYYDFKINKDSGVEGIYVYDPYYKYIYQIYIYCNNFDVGVCHVYNDNIFVCGGTQYPYYDDWHGPLDEMSSCSFIDVNYEYIYHTAYMPALLKNPICSFDEFRQEIVVAGGIFYDWSWHGYYEPNPYIYCYNINTNYWSMKQLSYDYEFVVAIVTLPDYVKFVCKNWQEFVVFDVYDDYNYYDCYYSCYVGEIACMCIDYNKEGIYFLGDRTNYYCNVNYIRFDELYRYTKIGKLSAAIYTAAIVDFKGTPNVTFAYDRYFGKLCNILEYKGGS